MTVEYPPAAELANLPPADDPCWLPHLEECPLTSAECPDPAHLSDEDREFLIWQEGLDRETQDPNAEFDALDEEAARRIGATPEQVEVLKAWTAAEFQLREMYAASLDPLTDRQLVGMVNKVISAPTANDKLELLLWAAVRLLAHEDAGHLASGFAAEMIRKLTAEIGLAEEWSTQVWSVARERYWQTASRWLTSRTEVG